MTPVGKLIPGTSPTMRMLGLAFVLARMIQALLGELVGNHCFTTAPAVTAERGPDAVPRMHPSDRMQSVPNHIAWPVCIPLNQ